mmetsp:Transcript_27233/g.78337  ORF Transcript_27233/g.78337 Transcript_27233/m.78337 type:complete len:218 (-) Transcript_27233:135-788(-)
MASALLMDLSKSLSRLTVSVRSLACRLSSASLSSTASSFSLAVSGSSTDGSRASAGGRPVRVLRSWSMGLGSAVLKLSTIRMNSATMSLCSRPSCCFTSTPLSMALPLLLSLAMSWSAFASRAVARTDCRAHRACRTHSPTHLSSTEGTRWPPVAWRTNRDHRVRSSGEAARLEKSRRWSRSMASGIPLNLLVAEVSRAEMSTQKAVGMTRTPSSSR